MQIDFQLKKDENRFITDWHKTEDGIGNGLFLSRLFSFFNIFNIRLFEKL